MRGESSDRERELEGDSDAITVSDCKIDHRPPRGGWADGHYMCKCFTCQAGFIGDKRATTCADCAYTSNTPRTDAAEEMAVKNYEMSRECGDPPFPGCDLADYARTIERELNEMLRVFRHRHQGFGSDTCRQCGLDLRHEVHERSKP